MQCYIHQYSKLHTYKTLFLGFLCLSLSSFSLFYLLQLYDKSEGKQVTQNNYGVFSVSLINERKGVFYSLTNHTNVFLGHSLQTIEIKKINKQMGPIKLISFCEAKKTINKMVTTYRMGENICKRCNRQGLNFQHIQTAHTTQQ